MSNDELLDLIHSTRKVEDCITKHQSLCNCGICQAVSLLNMTIGAEIESRRIKQRFGSRKKYLEQVNQFYEALEK